MPQSGKAGGPGLVAKWLPNPGPIPAQGMIPPTRSVWSGLRDKAKAVLFYEPLRNPFMCNLAKKFWIGASQISGTSLNTPTEKAMMARYFGGGGGTYRLSPAEWDAAVRYYDTHRYKTGDASVLDDTKFPTASGGYRQGVAFAKYDDEPLDGLPGSATGYFDRDKNLVGLRDTFDFDGAPRGTGYPIPFLRRTANALAGKAVNLVQKDADTFCPGGSRPVRIRGGNRR